MSLARVRALCCLASLALFGCVPVGGGGEGAENGGGAVGGGGAMGAADLGAGQAADAADPDADPRQFEGNEDCQFDPARQGKGVGFHIANFPVEQWDGSPFWFHDNCGGGVKAIWVFLSTGWCTACERYADTAQGFFRDFEDDGLRIVWIVGEDANHEPPTREYMEEYYRRKNVTFTVIRDNSFFQTQRFIDPSAAGNSLPRQYILDGQNMKMLFADGGVGSGAESVIACSSTTDSTLEECMALGSQ